MPCCLTPEPLLFVNIYPCLLHSDDDPSLFEDLYQDLKTFIDSCLDVHKVLILYWFTLDSSMEYLVTKLLKVTCWKVSTYIYSM